jgi:hypothetical protein
MRSILRRYELSIPAKIAVRERDRRDNDDVENEADDSAERGRANPLADRARPIPSCRDSAALSVRNNTHTNFLWNCSLTAGVSSSTMPGRNTPITRAVISLALLLTAVVAFAVVVAGYAPFRAHGVSGEVMLILRGVANSEHPRGQLDDESALEYARRLGYRGEVLDVAGGNGAQVKMALERIRRDDEVTALYGFSGGGYSTQRIWPQLDADERARIGKIVVIGSPGVDEDDFPGSPDVVIKQDPPAGHMAGPKALLESLGRT